MHSKLPESHLSSNSKDVVKLGVALIATTSAPLSRRDDEMADLTVGTIAGKRAVLSRANYRRRSSSSRAPQSTTSTRWGRSLSLNASESLATSWNFNRQPPSITDRDRNSAWRGQLLSKRIPTSWHSPASLREGCRAPPACDPPASRARSPEPGGKILVPAFGPAVLERHARSCSRSGASGSTRQRGCPLYSAGNWSPS